MKQSSLFDAPGATLPTEEPELTPPGALCDTLRPEDAEVAMVRPSTRSVAENAPTVDPVYTWLSIYVSGR